MGKIINFQLHDHNQFQANSMVEDFTEANAKFVFGFGMTDQNNIRLHISKTTNMDDVLMHVRQLHDALVAQKAKGTF